MTDRRFELAPEQDPNDLGRQVAFALAGLVLIYTACVVQTYVEDVKMAPSIPPNLPTNPTVGPSQEFGLIEPLELAPFIISTSSK